MAKSTGSSQWISRSKYNVVVVSLAFMVLFAAYNTLQNYATSLFPAGVGGGSLGNQSLAVLYITCAISVFAAPGMVNALGARVTMVIGAACYVVYMISLIQIKIPVVLAMSTVIGFGGAILWIALGVFISQNSNKDTYGRNTGLFWSIFQVCNIVGNLCTYLVFPKLSSTSLLYVAFSVTGGVGTSMLLLLRQPIVEGAAGDNAGSGGAGRSLLLDNETAATPFIGSDGDDSENGNEVISVRGMNSSKRGSSSASKQRRPSCGSRFSAFCTDLSRAGRLLLTRDMLLLMPMYFFSGLELSFWSGEFPQMLPNAAVIGLVLTFAGVGEVIGGVMFGRIGDTLGRSASITLGTAIYASGLAISCYMRSSNWNPAGPVVGGAPLLGYVAALCFGLGDSAFNANCYAICAQLYHDGPPDADADCEDDNSAGAVATTINGSSGDADADKTDSHAAGTSTGGGGEGSTQSVGAFTIFQLVQNIGSAVGFFYAIPVPMHDPNPSAGQYGTYTQAWVQAGILALAVVMFIAVDRIHAGNRKPSAGAEKSKSKVVG